MRTICIILLSFGLSACAATPDDLTSDQVDSTELELSATSEEEEASMAFLDALKTGADGDSTDLKLTDQEVETLFFPVDGLKDTSVGGDGTGGGLDTLDPKNGVAEFVCYPTGCVCSDVTTRRGYGCEGMAAECSRRGLPITCTSRSLICGCFSRVSQ